MYLSVTVVTDSKIDSNDGISRTLKWNARYYAQSLVIVYDAWTKVGLCLKMTGLPYLNCDAMCVAWDVRLSGRQRGYSMRNFLPIA